MFSTATKSAADATKASAENDVTSSIRKVADRAQDTAKHLRDDAVDYVSAKSDKVRSLTESAQRNLKTAADRTSSQIRANPLPSALIAIGIGLVVGLVLRDNRPAYRFR